MNVEELLEAYLEQFGEYPPVFHLAAEGQLEAALKRALEEEKPIVPPRIPRGELL